MPLRSRRGEGSGQRGRECPRCGATASRVVGEDQYGKYIQCLSCSASEELPDERRPNLPFARSQIVHRRDLDAADDRQGNGNGGAV